VNADDKGELRILKERLRSEYAIASLRFGGHAPDGGIPPGHRTDNKTDSEKKFSKPLPENPDVVRLAKRIKKELGPGTRKIDIALDFTGGDAKKAKSLLRQLQPSRFGHLLDP